MKCEAYADTDWLQYIASYGDLILAFGPDPAAGAQHYFQYGQAEGRVLDKFDELQYLANYSDLRQAFGNDTHAATIHFIQYGYREGRTDAPLTAAPDIVVVLTEHLGAAMLGPEARRVSVPTPNIDALAAAGTTYTQAYGTPVCVPSRAMTLLGRWPWRNSSGAIWHNGPQPPGSTVTVAERLRARGYATAVVGKWHLGFARGQYPLDQGFDHFLGFKGTTPNYFGDDPRAPLYRDRTRIHNTGYVTDTLADEAVRILQAPRSKPLFLYVPMMAFHPPLQTTLDFAAQRVDVAIGRIVSAAKPNTLFIFTSDHGDTRNRPLRGGKYDIWEGGVRVQFIVTWRGRVPMGARNATPISLLDIAPTIIGAAGATIPADLDGLNLLGNVPADRNVYFGAYGRAGYAVRQGRWKLYKNYERVATQLYDVLADKGETRNVAAGNANVVNALTAAITAWTRTIDD